MATVPINFSGIGSNTDWMSIVDKLVELEKVNMNRMQTWKTDWQNKITSIQGLNSRMLSLQSFVNSANTMGKFQAAQAVSSSTAVVNATASSTATPGSHTVTVGSDIQNKLASQGVASNSTVVSSRDGTMTIYVGSTAINVSVTNGMSLSALQSAITAADVGGKLTAAIIDDGSSANSKRLSLTANTGGSANLISVAANPTGLTFAENAINPVVNGGTWTGTSQATSSGYYLGSDDKTYTFTTPTVNLNGANSAALVSWSKTGGGTGSFIIPENYTAGTTIAVDGTVDDAVHSSTWSGTSAATSGGNYTGSVDKSYIFTVPDGTVGGGSDLTVDWSESTTGRTGTLTIPAAYAGTALNVDGVNDAVEGTWTGTSDATASGNYTGTDNQQYTFTVPAVNLDGANGLVTVNWTKVGGGSGSFDIPANYVAGTALDVENGVKIAFSSGNLVNGETFTVGTEQGPTVAFSNAGTGTLVDGETFTVDARTGLKLSFASGTLVSGENFYTDTFADIDTVQNGTWAGTSAASSGGHYLGGTNKTFKFTASNNGTVGTNAISFQWTDTEGHSGTVTLPSSYAAGSNLDVYQGLKLNLSAGTVVAGNTFSIDVYSPTLQGGQDSGLAQVEQVVHSGFPDSTTTKVTTNSGTFSFLYGGRRESIRVDANTTLSGLVTLINSDPTNPGVTASILDDGRGMSTSYHLVLTGRNTGAPYSITQINDTFTGGTFSSGGFTTTQQAQNSMIKVDGYPTDSQYIQRATNSVSDVINGVTLSLGSPGAATITISEDLSKIQENINTFVSSLNFVLDYAREETKYDADTKKAGIMIGNYSYLIIRQRIMDIVTSSIPGLTDGVDAYTHLSQIGIKTNPDNNGEWEVDAATLSKALNTNYQAVANLFAQNDETGTKGVLELLSEDLKNLTDSQDGPLNVLISNYDGIITDIDKRIDSEQKRVDLVQQRLTTQFANLETLLGELNGQQTSLTSLIDKLNGGTTSTG